MVQVKGCIGKVVVVVEIKGLGQGRFIGGFLFGVVWLLFWVFSFWDFSFCEVGYK